MRTRWPTSIVGGGGVVSFGAGSDCASSAALTRASANTPRKSEAAVRLGTPAPCRRLAEERTARGDEIKYRSLGQRPNPGEHPNIDDAPPRRYHHGARAARRAEGERPWRSWWLAPLAAGWLAGTVGLGGVARAQDNYEIQVYGSETVAPAVTMFELHSNFTIDGTTEPVGAVWPTEHALHETLEITHGFTPWYETGFYVFSSARAGGQGWQWVGDHIRPRFRAPESWGWPVGVSLSFEFGYNVPQVSPDIWTLEIRPIIDKQLGPWYFSINPALERTLVGPDVTQGLQFAPDGTAGYDVSSFVNLALEYYGLWGTTRAMYPYSQQQQQLFGAINLNFGPAWEFNFGLGEGFTPSTDHLIVKMILGRRIP
jgi:hypothetical protein